MSYKLKTKSSPAPECVASSNIETLGLVSLEPRILLDAAGFMTGADVAIDAMASEGAEIGTQAIFGGSEVAATPVIDGPWLGEVAATPVIDGPWLGEVAATPVIDGPWLGEVAATPVIDGPWL